MSYKLLSFYNGLIDFRSRPRLGGGGRGPRRVLRGLPSELRGRPRRLRPLLRRRGIRIWRRILIAHNYHVQPRATFHLTPYYKDIEYTRILYITRDCTQPWKSWKRINATCAYAIRTPSRYEGYYKTVLLVHLPLSFTLDCLIVSVD